jgi:hypothetical protein
MLLRKPSTFKSPHCSFQGKGRSLHTRCPTISGLAISLHRKRQRTLKVSDKILTSNELRQPGRRGPVFFFFGWLGEGGVLDFLDYCCSQCVPPVLNIFTHFPICFRTCSKSHLTSSLWRYNARCCKLNRLVIIQVSTTFQYLRTNIWDLTLHETCHVINI